MAKGEPQVTSSSEWRSGGWVVLSAAVANAAIGLPIYSLGALMKPLSDSFGWSRSEIAAGPMILSVVAIFLVPFVGRLVDRVGPRKMGLVGLPIFAAAIASLGLATPSIWSWYAGWLLLAFAQPVAGPLLWTSGVARRFDHSRAMALGVMLCGATVTIGLAPLIAVGIMEWAGWRLVYFVLGAFVLLVPWPLVYFRFDVGPIVHLGANATHNKAAGVSLGAAVRTRRYWQMVGAVVLGSASVGALAIHLQPSLIDGGLDRTTTALVASLLGPAALVGRLVAGFLADRIHAPAVAGVALALPGLSFLLLGGFDGSIHQAIAVAVLGGLAIGAEVDLFAYLCSRFFGQRHFGVIYGTMLSAFGLGYGAGPMVAGAIFDTTGNYSVAFYMLMLGSFLAALLVGFAGGSQKLALLRSGPPNQQTRTCSCAIEA